jgi:mannuronan synthase
MTEPLPHIVHEAEAHRQHVRINLPASVVIGDRDYEVVDWSNGGISINLPQGEPGFEKGAILPADLHLQFDGFEMTVPLQLEIVNADGKKGRVGARFAELDRRQRSIVQYLVSAYLSGELVKVGDLLNVVSRNNMTRARTIPDQKAGLSPAEIAKMRAATSLKAALLGIISLLLIGFIAMSIYEKLFVVEATSAQVKAEMMTLDTPAGGKIYYTSLKPDAEVKKGEPLLTISSNTGTAITADSPCDCIVKRRLTDNNRMVNKGDPVLELVRPEAKPFVEASLPHSEAVKLGVGQEALLSMPGDDLRLRATITSIEAGAKNTSLSKVILEPKETLPVKFINDPVEIRVDTLGIF